MFRGKSTWIWNRPTNYKEFIKKLQINHSKDVEARNIMYEKLTSLHRVQNKIIQTVDSIERYSYGTNDEVIYKREEIKCINTMKQCKRKQHKRS